MALFAFEAFGKKINDDVLFLALSLEYYHNALLIHDDIMDHDDLRRGFPSAHYHYQLSAKNEGVKDVKDFGNSMAICLGDASIFAAQFFLSKIKGLDNKRYRDLIFLLGQEFIKVGLGQAQDLVFAHYSRVPSSQEVIEMYNYKTARYTFSLPLMAGEILDSKDINTIKYLDKLGLSLGFIFQLSDDNLSLYGDSNITGKLLGNDIVANKKTLYRVFLYEKASKTDRLLIEDIFHQNQVDKKDIVFIKEMLDKYQINQQINNLIEAHVSLVKKYLKRLSWGEKNNNLILELINFLKNRDK